MTNEQGAKPQDTTTEAVEQAVAEIQDLVRCRCMPAYKDRGLHDPDCDCDSADAVAIVAARVAELEAENAKLMRIAQALDDAVFAWDTHQDSGDQMEGWWISEARTALLEKTND